MKSLALILLSSIVLTFASCKKEINVPTPELENIFGDWDLVTQCGGFVGACIEPDSAGFTQSISFTKSGKFDIIRDGKRISSGTFSFEFSDSRLSSKMQYQIHYSSDKIVNENINFNGKNTMYLSEDCFDCYGYTYSRR